MKAEMKRNKKKSIIIGLIIIIIILILLLLKSCGSKTYSITFKNYDGTILQVQEVKENDKPSFSGNVERASDENYEYSFISWDKEIVPATKDEVYIAVYKSTLIDSKSHDGSRLPNSSTETIDFKDNNEDEKEEIKEEIPKIDYTKLEYWIVTYDQYGNEIDRYTAPYGAVIHGPNNEEIIVKGNTKINTIIEEPAPPAEDPAPKAGDNLTIDGNNYKVLSVDEDNVAKVLSMDDIGVGVKFRDKEMIKIAVTNLDDSDMTNFQITTENKLFSYEPGEDVTIYYTGEDVEGISYGGSLIENYLDNDYYSGLSDNIKNAIVEKNYYQKIIETNCNGEEYAYHDYDTSLGSPEKPKYIVILGQHDFGPKKVRPMGVEDILDYMPKTFYKEDVFELLYNRRTTEKATNALYLVNAKSGFPKSFMAYSFGTTCNFINAYPVPLKPAVPYQYAYRAVMYLDLDKLEYTK